MSGSEAPAGQQNGSAAPHKQVAVSNAIYEQLQGRKIESLGTSAQRIQSADSDDLLAVALQTHEQGRNCLFLTHVWLRDGSQTLDGSHAHVPRAV